VPNDETVYVNGKIFTGSRARPWAECIRVQGTRIRSVGSRDDVGAGGSAGSARSAPGGGAAEVDLHGRVVVPGFIDAHNHYLATAEALAAVDLRYPRVSSIESLVADIAERAAQTRAGDWIRGFGMDYAKFTDRRLPTRWDLDAATKDHPVIAYHVSGHYALVNSAALALRDIGEDVADPPGGTFVRDGGGRLTGLCLDAATSLILPVQVDVGSHGPNFHTEAPLADLVGLLDKAGPAYHAAGLTTVCDPQVTQRELTAYRAALAAGKLHVRVACMPLSHELPELRAVGLAGPFGDERLSITGMKFYADGSLIGGTAAFTEPYGEHQEYLGSTYWSPEQLTALVGQGHEAGWQVGIHAQGDRAIQMAIDAVAAALHARPATDPRPRIEHAGYPTPAQLRQIRDLGIITVNQPSYLYDSGNEFLARLGGRAHRLQPLREELDAGIGVVLSSDAFVASYRPLDTIRAAVHRRTREGAVIGEDQRIYADEAIRAHTIEAAYAIGMDHLVGSIEAGKLADFVVLDGDPFSPSAQALDEVSVYSTVLGGQIVSERAGDK
jgi:predicted amidohydrolase YtcJ